MDKDGAKFKKLIHCIHDDVIAMISESYYVLMRLYAMRIPAQDMQHINYT